MGVGPKRTVPRALPRGAKRVRLYDELGLCSVCGEQQFITPSGASCLNGHGGAPARPGTAVPIEHEIVVDRDGRPLKV